MVGLYNIFYPKYKIAGIFACHRLVALSQVETVLVFPETLDSTLEVMDNFDETKKFASVLVEIPLQCITKV